MLRTIGVGVVALVLASGCSSAEPGGEEAATPTPSETSATFAISGDGTWQVGADVQPGVYVAEGGPSCEWRRLSGDDADQLEARGMNPHPVVEILDGDTAFTTEGCGGWAAFDDYTGPKATEIPGDGVWVVGEDVVPGTYRAEGGSLCTWQRLSGFRPELSSVITMGGESRVTLEPGDAGFVTTDCGSWSKTG